MPKGTRLQKVVVYLFTALLVLVMSWEYQRGVAASVITEDATLHDSIPDDSIRLRVLAHDDTPQEQWLKRKIRDEIVDEIQVRVEDVTTIAEARGKMEDSLEDIESLVHKTIQESGMQHTFTVEFGDVQFPAKLYGNQLYPAGVYEALLITIGAGQGANWWCVLFPPLCFVDFGTGETLDEEQEVEQEQDSSEVEVRFFLVEVFEQLKSWFT